MRKMVRNMPLSLFQSTPVCPDLISEVRRPDKGIDSQILSIILCNVNNLGAYLIEAEINHSHMHFETKWKKFTLFPFLIVNLY